MKTVIISIIFNTLFCNCIYSQAFNSNEQYSGTIDEIKDSVLKNEILSVKSNLYYPHKNKIVKKINMIEESSDSTFKCGYSGNLFLFNKENTVYTLKRIRVGSKEYFDFPLNSFNDFNIVNNTNKNTPSIQCFKSIKRSDFLFHCVNVTIQEVPYTVIFISNLHSGFLGRVLIKSN